MKKNIILTITPDEHELLCGILARIKTCLKHEPDLDLFVFDELMTLDGEDAKHFQNLVLNVCDWKNKNA